MLFGTIFGVIIVPGLYYIFGSLAEGRKLIKNEDANSLTEDLVHRMDDFPQTEESENNE
jgi:HAE1 family hydrophobic/amphiphilic exporter-1